jgi:hypothetical protein
MFYLLKGKILTDVLNKEVTNQLTCVWRKADTSMTACQEALNVKISLRLTVQS